jgi:hypothetical protein
MTPTREQLNRTHAKAWLLEFATPEALRAIYEAMCGEDTHDSRMIERVYFEITGRELNPLYEAARLTVQKD